MKSNTKSKKKSFLTIISLFMLILYIFPLSIKPFQGIHVDLNENSINHLYSKSLKLEISGSIVENPIFINGSATGLTAHNWTWAEEQDWCSGSGTLNDPYVIENLFIDGKNQSNCIEIHNSAKFLILRECTVFNSSLSKSVQASGIFLKNVSNSILSDNECNYNAFGLLMEQCSNNNITGNSASFNTWAGFHLHQCDNNTISNNVANNNIGAEVESMGICLWLCDFNLVSENTASYNKYGIWLCSQVTIWGSHNNTILNNTVSYNEVGIVLYGAFGRCYNNTISGNIVSNNLNYGIWVARSPQNIFCKNIVRDNENDGIYLYKESHNNTFTENVILNNGQKGLKIDYISSWNLIYYNCFIGNGLNAQDNGTSNKWDNGVSGNYWDDYDGVDANDDGIGDTPYDIPPAGSSVDNFPLMKCPHSLPQEGGGIPGYNLFILLSILSVVLFTISKKLKKS